MGAPLRVLVVDDSVVMRRLLSDALAKDPDLLVVATAASGRVALAKMGTAKPDVITLDIEMPDMDGLATLRELRAAWPNLPVIMCSALTERGASITLDALALGASDYVTKPTHGHDPTAFAATLAAKVKAVGRQQPVRATPTSAAPSTTSNPTRGVPPKPANRPPTTSIARPNRADVVAIGVSTGGPNALATLLPGLPADLAVPVVIVQHMPPLFTRLLAERLGRGGHLPVSEAVPGEPLRPGHVYIAPGDHHLVVVGPRAQPTLALTSDPPENSCRPAVDVLFRSVAEVYGPAALAVVLTGMGQDGLRGAEQIRKMGGQVLAQDQASSVVWGMPGFIAQAGLAEAVVPLSGMAEAIAWRLRHARSAGDPLQGDKACAPSS